MKKTVLSLAVLGLWCVVYVVAGSVLALVYAPLGWESYFWGVLILPGVAIGILLSCERAVMVTSGDVRYWREDGAYERGPWYWPLMLLALGPYLIALWQLSPSTKFIIVLCALALLPPDPVTRLWQWWQQEGSRRESWLACGVFLAFIFCASLVAKIEELIALIKRSARYR